MIFHTNYAGRVILRLTLPQGSHYISYINCMVLARQHLHRYNAKLLAPLSRALVLDCNRRRNTPYRHTIIYGPTNSNVKKTRSTEIRAAHSLLHTSINHKLPSSSLMNPLKINLAPKSSPFHNRGGACTEDIPFVCEVSLCMP